MKSAPAKPIFIDANLVKDYKGFKIGRLAASHVLIMGETLITETVSKLGCTKLADAIIDLNMMGVDPLTIAKDWYFKLVTVKENHQSKFNRK